MSVPVLSAASPIPIGPLQAPSTTSAPVTERLILGPCDRTCPVLRGRSSLGPEEWIEGCKHVLGLATCPHLIKRFYFLTKK